MDVLKHTEERLKETIEQAVITSKLASKEEIPKIILEKPKEKKHGDFATNIAMQLARIAKKAPRQIAEDILSELNKEQGNINQVEIAGPGFINFFMKEDYLTEIVPNILQQGADYGRTNTGEGKKVQVEFVSVNPTGALHLGHARGAAYGDVLCNILAYSGHKVDREYYINDAGNQIDNLAKSVEARYYEALGLEKEMPEDGYHGEDIKEIGEALKEEYKDTWLEASEEERLAFFKEYSLRYELDLIKTDLDEFRVHFDNWFSERSLYNDNQIDDALQTLTDGGYTYEKDGATWFKTTDFSDDKDRVLVKQDGSYTYLTPDIAYHKNKLERGYDKIINIWGADHHGYVPRMEAAIQALGYSKDTMEVKIIQMVNLLESGEKIRMSKRSGNAVALSELVKDVGVDAVRYYFVTRSNDSQLDFDVELARSETNENPIYYIQYAHARICTMLEQAEKRGFAISEAFDPNLFTNEKEVELIKQLALFPQLVSDAAKQSAPHRVTMYVLDLASALHSFYNAVVVLDEDNKEQTNARINLMKAVKITLQNGLQLLGVTAPEKM